MTNSSRGAATTHAFIAAIQRSQASTAQLSKELVINPKIVAKRCKSVTMEDLVTEPKEPRLTLFTDYGIQFAEQPRNQNTAYSRQMRFDMICEANGIDRRLTNSNHP